MGEADYAVRGVSLAGTGAEQQLLPADPKRVAIVIPGISGAGAPGDVRVKLTSGGTVFIGGGSNFPVVLTYKEVGPLVSCAWVTIGGFGSTATIIEVTHLER